MTPNATIGTDDTKACPCTVLVEPFVDDPLPNHVCYETMIATVRTATRDGILPVSEHWPVSFQGRRLGFVLRQWVQEDPSETLANQLAASPAWRREVKALKIRFSPWRKRNPKADLSGWVDGTAWRRNGDSQFDAGAGRDLAQRLRQRGLPHTPATVRHLRAVAAGCSSAPLPARGILVTTFVYIRAFQPTSMTEPLLFIDENSEVSVTGLLELVTGPILDQATRAVLTHRTWLRQWEQHPLADMSAVRRAQRGAFEPATEKDEDWYCYRVEALRIPTEELRRQASANINGLEGAITQHLNSVYRRVRKRRTDAGLPPATPPPDWRREARLHLRSSLKPFD